MKKPTKKIARVPRFFSSLIRRAYLPTELPPAFTAENFADFCAKDYSWLKSQQNILERTATEYETFTVPRTKAGRRSLALVHPTAQMNVSLLLTEHREKIKDLVGKNRTTLYRTEDDLDRSFAYKGLDFAKRRVLQARAYSECRVILNADISRFFYTLYTHSIPWAVLGKEKAKDLLGDPKSRKKLDRHWSGRIDRAMQLCQSRETFGIPVGPDTSRLIAEILLAGIERDERLAKSLARGFAFRLVDDFTVGFDTDEEAQEALAALRHALWKFNLQLNDEKTAIKSWRNVMRPRWELEHESFDISDVDTKLQATQIARLVELTFHFCLTSNSDTPALWTCRRISQLKNIKENFDLILDCLFRLSREFSRCSNYVASIVINNQDFSRKKKTRSRVARWCKSTIVEHLRHGHDFEIAWALVVCGVLKIPLGPNDMGGKKQMLRPSTMALIGLLNEKRLSKVALSNWSWRAELRRSGVFGPYWLPYYEAVRRGWTSDKGLISKVTADPILSRMLAAKVTFLDDQVFDAAQIKLPRRASTGGRARIRTKSSIATYRAAKKKGLLGGGFAKARIIIADSSY